MHLCKLIWTWIVWHKDTGLCPCRSDSVHHKWFCCLSCRLLYGLFLNWPLILCIVCSVSSVGATSWQSFHCQELHTVGKNHKSELLWFFCWCEWGVLSWCHDAIRDSLWWLLSPTPLVFLILGTSSGSWYSSSSFFWLASLWTLSSCTFVNSQMKMHLHLWLNRKAVNFSFFCSMTETWCPRLGALLAFLPPDFLMMLQISTTFLSVRTCKLVWAA